MAKVLTIGLLAPLDVLDPRMPQQETVLVLRQMLEPPFDIVAGSEEVRPVLFDGPLVRDPVDALTYRGRVRNDLHFSDGAPAGAADVVASLRQSPVVRDRAEVTAAGSEVQFRLRRANARLEASLTHAHCYVHRRQGSQLLGTGPFRMSFHTPREVRLARNPHYRHPVALDEVHFRVYPPDADGRPQALIDALQKGEVDLSTVLPRDAANKVSGVRKVVLPGVSTAVLFVNVASPRLSDVRVRRALCAGIDRAEFAADTYENPLAFAAASLLPRTLAAASDGLRHDLPQARQLLAAAGGQAPARLSVLLVWGPRPYLPNPTRAADLLVRQLSRLDIAVDLVRTSTLQEYYQAMIDGRQDLTLAGWTADTMDAADFLDSCLASDRIPNATNASVSVNNSRLRNSGLDAALDAYRAERADASLQEIMRLVREEGALVPLMYGSTCTVSAFRVANLKPSPLGFMDLSAIDLT